MVHGSEGMDEISPRGADAGWEVRDGGCDRVGDRARRRSASTPGELDELAGGEPAENAARIDGGAGRERSRGSARDALRLNAAAALYVAGRGWSFAESLARATEALDAGKGMEALRDALRDRPHCGI